MVSKSNSGVLVSQVGKTNRYVPSTAPGLVSGRGHSAGPPRQCPPSTPASVLAPPRGQATAGKQQVSVLSCHPQICCPKPKSLGCSPNSEGYLKWVDALSLAAV